MDIWLWGYEYCFWRKFWFFIYNVLVMIFGFRYCLVFFIELSFFFLFFFIHFFLLEGENERGLRDNDIKFVESFSLFFGWLFESRRGHQFMFLRISLKNCLNLNENRSCDKVFQEAAVLVTSYKKTNQAEQDYIITSY